MAKDDFDIKAEYEKLKHKYKELPPFEEINNNFELIAIDKPGFRSRQIRRLMHDRVIFFCRIIEGILYFSSQSAISAYEANFFNEEEKEEISKIHKRLMIYERESLCLDVNSNENSDIEYIIKLSKEWNELKKELDKIANKMKDCWQKELKEESEKYFG